MRMAGSCRDRCEAIFANTGRERPETLDFVQALTERWGMPVTWLEYVCVPGGTPTEAGSHRGPRDCEPRRRTLQGDARSRTLGLPSVAKGGRVCTAELKVSTIDRYMWARHGLTRRQTRKLLGFRFDEPARWRPAVYQACEVAYPMVEAGVTAGDVAAWWANQAFDLGIASARGNCDCCYGGPSRVFLMDMAGSALYGPRPGGDDRPGLYNTRPRVNPCGPGALRAGRAGIKLARLFFRACGQP